MKKRFLISVIMPVYRTEAYVEESIKCIIDQTIGFSENIELILVNDATDDGAEIICKTYSNKYPENISYIELSKNSGPSGARNAGLEVARGEYINFIDSDDLWEPDALEILYDFMVRNGETVDVAVGRIRHFDDREEWHNLDWKFKNSIERIIDIDEDPECIQLHLCSALFKADVAQSKKLDENVRHSEDNQYFNRIMLHKGKYGLVSDAIYLYRTRTTGKSAIQTAHHNLMWYVNTVERVYKFFIQYSNEKYGYVHPYFQYLLMHEMQWRLTNPMDCDEVDVDRYIKNIREIVSAIDDKVILKSRYLWEERKLYAMCLKRCLETKTEEKRNYLQTYYPIEDGLHIQSVLSFDHRVHIKGFIRFPYEIEYSMQYEIGGKTRDVDLVRSERYDVYSLGNCIAESKSFFINVPHIRGYRIHVFLKIDENEYLQKMNRFGNTKVDLDKVVIADSYIECK